MNFFHVVALIASGLFGFRTNTEAQSVQKITQLPAVVHETSGIELTGPNRIWTFNDSGGDPALYLCDTTGQLLRTVSIQGAWNRDWEDITQDNQGNFYIGNIGNNNNDATDLTIFKIPNPDQTTDSVITAEVIYFHYEDQHAFPPPKDSFNFDCEALFWYQDHLYLCTKNRTQPFDGLIHLYRLPDSPGTYEAQKTATFATDGKSMINYWITAGDISPDGSKLCLLSSDRLWVFYDFPEDAFFSGKFMEFDLHNFSQKEAVCFVNESTLYISDEELMGGFGRNLYRFSLNEALTDVQSYAGNTNKIKIFPNPCIDWITVEGSINGRKVELFDENGLRHKTIKPTEASIRIPLSDIPAGVYYLKVSGESKEPPQLERIIKTKK
ncbi:MAG: T9SS type A sorting domain-containing protein [Saprospiraceae bacterium]|nr:T9SS type A sorting domain-containing protein [Saprospiraceae bacterium]